MNRQTTAVRTRTSYRVSVALLGLLLIAGISWAGKKKAPKTTATSSPVAEATTGMEKVEGPVTVFLDQKAEKIWLELPPPDATGFITELLYTNGLMTGLGSNPVGLDRGKLGRTQLVRLRRVGQRLLIEQPNLSYRAITNNPDEARAVRDSFATSVLWAGKITAEDPDGRALVDFTSFVVRDAHGIAGTLKRSGQGSFSLDSNRSVIRYSDCLGFPNNLELEALLTFSGKEPGRHVRSTTPTADSVTLTQHHSFVTPPDDGYRPRVLDPRAGSFGVSYLDYAVPLDVSMDQRWIVRHRLEKTDPSAAVSTVVEPIVYYVDSGAPEPIRSALIEGASWWAKAFEEAGFVDAFRVEVLPPNAHPLDIRYNVIQWVHRSTRGWSYGGGVSDPRTGEMLKGHVSLGSLRVRQDIRIFEGLLGTEGTGSGAADDPVELALARIRQLSAHEVGHTLGFAHNFTASTYGRASVMDYPAPWVVAEEGSLNTSKAYGVGVGAWDHYTVKYAYSEFAPNANEAELLDAIVDSGIEEGLRFASDGDSRAPGSAHPLANLWDNGSDAVEELANVLEVRRIALERFDASRIAEGQPLSTLQETLAPIYFYHRYQVEAAARALGGVDYSYALRGDSHQDATVVAPEKQWEALDLLLTAISPEALDIPESVLADLLPRPFGVGYNRELFNSRTSPTFDPLGAATSGADLVLQFVLQPERMARIVDFNRRDDTMPSLEAILDRVLTSAFAEAGLEPRHAEIKRAVQGVLVSHLLDLVSSEATSPEVRSRLFGALEGLHEELDSTSSANRDHRQLLRAHVGHYLKDPTASVSAQGSPLELPPGSPIGSSSQWEWMSNETHCSWRWN